MTQRGDDVREVVLAVDGSDGAPAVAEFEQALEARMRSDAAEVARTTGTSAVPVVPAVRYGHPARSLMDVAGDDGLLVVGSCGMGGLRGLLLGSVGQRRDGRTLPGHGGPARGNGELSVVGARGTLRPPGTGRAGPGSATMRLWTSRRPCCPASGSATGCGPAPVRSSPSSSTGRARPRSRSTTAATPTGRAA